MDELREDFNRGFAQHSREIRDLGLQDLSPYFDPGAEKLARDLGIETFTSAREVRV